MTFIALTIELVAAIRLWVASLQAFWRGGKCFATNQLVYEHTTHLSTKSTTYGSRLTINQKERKRPDPANLTS
jgi:hypothetical protein